MANSPEYNSIVDCIPELRCSVEPNIISLCGELLRTQLINEDKEKSLRNRSVEEADRAAELVSLITNKVQEDPKNYHTFVAVLKKNEQWYNAVITQLEKNYEARIKGAVESPGSKPSSRQDSGM